MNQSNHIYEPIGPPIWFDNFIWTNAIFLLKIDTNSSGSKK